MYDIPYTGNMWWAHVSFPLHRFPITVIVFPVTNELPITNELLVYFFYSSPMDASGTTDRNITVHRSDECSNTKESCPNIITTTDDSVQ